MRRHPTRRDWLAAVGAGAWALTACGDNAAPPRFAGLFVGVQTWSFRTFTLADMLMMAADLGFLHVELTPGEGETHLQFPATDDEIASLRREITRYGLACTTSHIAPRGVDYPPDRDVFVYAKKLGLSTIMITLMTDDLDDLVDEFDIRVGLHNHTGSIYSTIADIKAAVEGRDPRIGTIVDTGHYTRVGNDPVEALRTFGSRVFGVHLKDVDGAHAMASDAPLGEGLLDLTRVVRALHGLPSRTPISVEYESNPFDPYADLERALDNLSRVAHATR